MPRMSDLSSLMYWAVIVVLQCVVLQYAAAIIHRDGLVSERVVMFGSL